MRKLLYLIAAMVIIGYGVLKWVSFIQEQMKTTTVEIAAEKSNPSIVPIQGDHDQSIFVPYWNIPSSASSLDKYDTLIYFGVSPDENGELIQDTGYTNIASFIQHTSGNKERLLTVRMLDDEVSLAIVDDVGRQSSVINQTRDLVEQYGFDGVVLDLEMGVIPFEDTKNKITHFVSQFARDAHDSKITFSMTIYGDALYRVRPYDVKELSPHVDQIYIMAYDFHKSRGEPGPNFPLTRSPRRRFGEAGRSESEGGHKKEYGYDFQTMIADFTQIVPREKITVLFGMYGYDWTLGAQGKPLKAATAVPLLEIDTGGAIINPNSKEKYIEYLDDEGYEHVLWYEDHESVNVKIDYLKTQGIGRVGYWVWGYF